MKRLLIVICCFPLFALAQDKLIAEGSSTDLYLKHVVAPKENYYSIGRMYNISPKVFAPYNNLSMDKGLSLGQTIKIPLNTTNFLQSGNPADGEVLIAVYRDAGKANPIGYLRVKKDLSSLAAQGVATPVKDLPKPVMPVQAPPKKIINTDTVASVSTKKDILSVRPEVKPVVKNDQPNTTEETTTDRQSIGGAFKNDYVRQSASKEAMKESGAAAVFKSTSGWDDAKYYCLYNTATSGSIVKITNSANGESVYAKVLDIIPDIKQNTGLVIRVSNAAAQQLGIKDESRFDCTVEYSK